MTTGQKNQITHLRNLGHTYADISKVLNMSESTVKSFCWRNKVQNKPISEKDICRNCRSFLVHTPDAPPRKFCSDKCRFEWWRKYRKPNNSAVCICCEKEFHYYGKATRKYCSQRCCIKHRFGEDAYDQKSITARD